MPEATTPAIHAPAGSRGWRLSLAAVAGGAALRVELEPGRHPMLHIGEPGDDPPAPGDPADTPELLASEPAGGAAPVSPRHAVLAFAPRAGTDESLVALIGHVGREGVPAAGGFCLEIRGVVGARSPKYAFEHPAGRITLTTAAGGSVPGGRDDRATREVADVRVWPADERGQGSPAALPLIATFAPRNPNLPPVLRAWFTAEPDDDLLTATHAPLGSDRPGTPPRLLVVRRPPSDDAAPFITVFEPATPGPAGITSVITESTPPTRRITVTTHAVVHTLIHHLGDEPYITPDLSLDGRFAAVTRAPDGTLIDAFLGDGNALVLPELTLDAQGHGTRSAYRKP